MLHNCNLASAASGRSTYRRYYKKSITGCDACKTRKIKCDESRPTCLNCRRHYTSAASCHYSCDPRSLQDGNVVPQPTKSLMRPVTLDSTNTLALRLMHHYTISIGLTRSPESHPKNILARSMWEVKIPSIAFDSELVLNALLGISAWHLWAVSPNEQKMKLISRNYFGEAIRLQRAALEQPDSKQLTPAFIAGIILAHHSWLLSDTDGYSPELQLVTFYLCNGYRTLGKKLSPAWPEYACLGEVIPHKIGFGSTKYEKLVEEGIQDCNYILEMTQRMDIDSKIKAAYCMVIGELWSMYALVASDNNDFTVKEFVVVSFLHRVPSSFINLLQRQDPLAMGLLARMWALLAPIHEVSTSWYIHGAGKFRVYTYAVANITSLMPGDWACIFRIPLRNSSKIHRVHDHSAQGRNRVTPVVPFFNIFGAPHERDAEDPPRRSIDHHLLECKLFRQTIFRYFPIFCIIVQKGFTDVL